MKLALVLFGLACLVAEPAHAQERSVTVQAICMDARGMPHPASQTFAQRDVAATYAGELFRCLPGTAMRSRTLSITIAPRAMRCGTRAGA
jgi:hypothetical protein